MEHEQGRAQRQVHGDLAQRLAPWASSGRALCWIGGELMKRQILIMALRAAPEPTSHLLSECETILRNDESDSPLVGLIGRALDRWGISKEELSTRNRLCIDDTSRFLIEKQASMSHNESEISSTPSSMKQQ